jgi:lipopolysaccharide biosynthesis regulator YciM
MHKVKFDWKSGKEKFPTALNIHEFAETVDDDYVKRLIHWLENCRESNAKRLYEINEIIKEFYNSNLEEDIEDVLLKLVDMSKNYLEDD